MSAVALLKPIVRIARDRAEVCPRLPGRGIATRSPDCQLHVRSVRPVPFVDEFVHVGWGKGAEGVCLDRARQIKPEIARSIEQLALSALRFDDVYERRGSSSASRPRRTPRLRRGKGYRDR